MAGPLAMTRTTTVQPPPFQEQPPVTVTDARTVDILSRLVESTLDSAYRYREAAGDARSVTLRTLFEGRCLERRRLTAALRGEVRTLGGAPDEDDMMRAAAQRIFIELRESLANGDRRIVDEVTARDAVLAAQLAAALVGDALPPSAHGVVSRARASVAADHDQMGGLEHWLLAAPPTEAEAAPPRPPQRSLVGP